MSGEYPLILFFVDQGQAKKAHSSNSTFPNFEARRDMEYEPTAAAQAAWNMNRRRRLRRHGARIGGGGSGGMEYESAVTAQAAWSTNRR